MLITAGEKREKATPQCNGGTAWSKEHPGDIELMEALAEALAQAGMTREAVNKYESVVHTNPTRVQS